MNSNIKKMIKEIGVRAKKAEKILAKASGADINRALIATAEAVRGSIKNILSANQIDVKNAEKNGSTKAELDRIMLNEGRVLAMANAIFAIENLPNPLGKKLSVWERPNGLEITRITVPIGVIGIIYESRPNVTADAGGLCLKSGNVAVLRGGSDCFNSSMAIMECFKKGLEVAGLPEDCIIMIPTTDRSAVGEMLKLSDCIDVIVPRGGKSLISRITKESKIPLFKHLEGICHTYIHKSADINKATSIVVNGKMRRTGVCNATETMLIDEAVLETHLPPIIKALIAKGCEIRGDKKICKFDKRIIPAKSSDWDTEYLDAVISIKAVKNLDDAIEHIAKHSSSHTETIVAEDKSSAERFLFEVDSAVVMHNASTAFSDGGEFGMGAEIGIATGKLHARGPVGIEQLVSFKYQLRGNGQVRE